MSLVLLRSGYPTVAVRPEDHQAYFATLQKVQASAGIEGLIACFTRGLMSRRTVGVWQPGLVTSRQPGPSRVFFETVSWAQTDHVNSPKAKNCSGWQRADHGASRPLSD